MCTYSPHEYPERYEQKKSTHTELGYTNIYESFSSLLGDWGEGGGSAKGRLLNYPCNGETFFPLKSSRYLDINIHRQDGQGVPFPEGRNEEGSIPSLGDNVISSY